MRTEAVSRRLADSWKRHRAAWVVTVAVVLVGGTVLVGYGLQVSGIDLLTGTSVLLRADVDLGAGPMIGVAVLIAALVVGTWLSFTARLPWRGLLSLSVVASVAWSLSLAASKPIRGGRNGVTGPLESKFDYLHDVPRVRSLPNLLQHFIDHVPASSTNPWTVHVAGHPPGPLAVFAALQAIGLGGSGWAAALCVAVGASSVAAVLVAVRSAYGEAAARKAAPFLILGPWSLWIATSADALWLGLSAWAVAMLALAIGRRSLAGVMAAGIVYGLTLFGSYGMVLFAPLVLVVVLRLSGKRIVPNLASVVVGALIPVIAAGVAGFWWWEGVFALVNRYYDGPAAINRPYAFFVFANLAIAAIGLGGAVVAGFSRTSVRRNYLAWAALGCILLADLSGLSKGEVERIWLPFYPWAALSVLAIPRCQVRHWLIAQAILAIALQVLLRTDW